MRRDAEEIPQRFGNPEGVRVGIFGGSFDPPHLGHFLAAVDATEALELDQLFWVPTSRQPLKSDGEGVVSRHSSDSSAVPLTAPLRAPLVDPLSDPPSPHDASAEDRYAMVEAMVAQHPKFVASRIEIDRIGLSYTVTTVEAFAQHYPTAERFLLMGADAWNQFGSWYQPERIRTFVQVAVLARMNLRTPETPVTEEPALTSTPDHWLSTRVIDISSTEVRARVRAGKPIRGFVSDAVAALIESKGLYRW